MSNGNGNTHLAIPIIGGLLLVLVVGWLVATTQVRGPEPSGEPVTLAASGATSAEAAAQDTGDKAALLEAAIPPAEKAGCAACHTIPGIPNAQGQVGPNLSNIGAEAGSRIDGYTAEEYIHESIANPTAFTAPKCPFGDCVPGGMPQLNLTEEEIQALVNYLVTLGG